jgi:DNA helicase HerA-like ATPase
MSRKRKTKRDQRVQPRPVVVTSAGAPASRSAVASDPPTVVMVGPLLPEVPASLVGFVNFDGRSGDGNVSEVVVDAPFIESFRRGRYVEIDNHGRKALYLGRIVEGPYYSPDFVGIDSSIARVAIQKAASISMMPDFHAYASVEVLGEIQGDALIGLTTRPLPKSRVNSVDGSKLTSLLRIDGDAHLGRLDGYDNIEVSVRSDAKHVLPRNVGIFGTVGSGKTNTSQVLIEQLSGAGWAIVVLDVEGEYSQMNEKSTELLERLKAVGKAPAGLTDFQVLHPIGSEPEDDESSVPFAVNFGGLPASMIAELVGMNDAQQERFFQLYDACARENLFGPVKMLPKSADPKRSALRGRPKKSLLGPTGTKDRKGKIKASPVSGGMKAPNASDALAELELVDEEMTKANVTLQQLMTKLLRWLQDRHDDLGHEISGASLMSWNKVKSQLRGIHRLGIFDPKAKGLNISQVLQEGRVTVINLSDSSDPRVNNLVIADVLRGVFEFKKTHPNPKAMIVIEEAHTFVSRDNVRQMQATMDKLREIARRGRKRWLGLTFISQQPSHLPAELFELCNTLFVHETNGRRNVDALKSTAGTINEGVWRDISVMGQGRCVIVCPQYRHPVVVQIDPCVSKRKLIE